MYVPIPILVGAAILFLVLLVAALGSGRGRRRDLVVPPTPVNPPAGLDEELRRLLAADRKIEAIKRVREATGLGLKEAKDYVDAREVPQ